MQWHCCSLLCSWENAILQTKQKNLNPYFRIHCCASLCTRILKYKNARCVKLVNNACSFHAKSMIRFPKDTFSSFLRVQKQNTQTRESLLSVVRVQKQKGRKPANLQISVSAHFSIQRKIIDLKNSSNLFFIKSHALHVTFCCSIIPGAATTNGSLMKYNWWKFLARWLGVLVL